jgi:hypothetical protein
MMSRFLLLFLIFAKSFSSIASDNLISIKSISKSGKTVIVGHGAIKNIEEGDLGAFFLKEGGLEEPLFSFLSESRCIKVSANDSIWYFENALNLGDIKGGSVVLMTKANILSGHAKATNLGKVIYSERQSIRNIHGRQSFPIWLEENYSTGVGIDREDDEASGDDDEFSFMEGMEGDEYKSLNKPIIDDVVEFEEESIDQGDRYIEEFNRYSKVKLLKRTGKKELIRQKERESERAEVLNLSKGSFSKLAAYENGLIDLYEDVSVDQRDLAEETSGVNSSFQDYNMATRGLKRQILENKKDSKRLDDPLWPSGLSDLELRRYFISHGIDEFNQRKELVLHNKPSHEILMRLSFALNRNTTDTDPNYQSINKSLYIGYEWHLMKASYFLRYFSLEFGAESTSGQYEVGNNTNAYSYEFAGRMMLNFYLNNYPSSVGKLNWYIGAGGKLGNAVLRSINLSRSYNYFQITLPSFQAGVKYRFRAGDEMDILPRIGLGWNLSMIADNHSFYNSRELFDDIKPNFYAADFKFVLGIGLYF